MKPESEFSEVFSELEEMDKRVLGSVFYHFPPSLSTNPTVNVKMGTPYARKHPAFELVIEYETSSMKPSYIDDFLSIPDVKITRKCNMSCDRISGDSSKDKHLYTGSIGPLSLVIVTSDGPDENPPNKIEIKLTTDKFVKEEFLNAVKSVEGVFVRNQPDVKEV
jgi:hypothetical protein